MEPMLDTAMLWKGLSALSAVVAGLVVYLWKRLESRVADLEQTSANHDDIVDLRGDLKSISEKIDTYSQRADDGRQRLMEILLNKVVG